MEHARGVENEVSSTHLGALRVDFTVLLPRHVALLYLYQAPKVIPSGAREKWSLRLRANGVAPGVPNSTRPPGVLLLVVLQALGTCARDQQAFFASACVTLKPGSPSADASPTGPSFRVCGGASKAGAPLLFDGLVSLRGRAGLGRGSAPRDASLSTRIPLQL